MTELPKQLTIKQVAEVYGIPENTIRAYVHRRIIPFRKLRGRIYLDRLRFEAWLHKFDVLPIAEDSVDETENNKSQ